ncbi:MAG: radical SAM protein, partial [Chloroflexi bacterium]|nr:radical SAM protein [Chloroflexota bacterium]
EILRPPSEHDSYFLPLTSGCSNNTCAFCSYYGSKLQLRDVNDAKREVDALALYVESGICLSDMPPIVYAISRGWDGKRIFLQDGDALVYPFPKLKEVLEHVNRKFPALERIGSYATPQDILRRSLGELKELQKLKLGIFYMGVESGDEDVLKAIGKGIGVRQMIEAGRKVKDAGSILSATVILGLGGVAGSTKHALETAKILTAIDPDFVGALTLTLVPGTPLYQQWQEGRFSLISPFQSLKELKIIIENSAFTDCFFSSMHASNYLSVRGQLPQDKQRMLNTLESVLQIGDSSLLRPEFLRGL